MIFNLDGSKFLEVFWHRPDVIRQTVESYGPYGPLVFIFIQVLQIVLAPLPGEITGFIAGYLFGAFWGFIYAMIGLTIGSSIAFYIARYFRRFFAKKFSRSKQFRRLEIFICRRGLLAIFICYLFPGFPKDSLNYFVGLFPIPFRVFLVIMVLGRIPGTLALVLQGASLYEKNWVMLGIVGGLSLILLGLFYWKRKIIYEYLDKNAPSLS
ncbi:SNARE associated Golgi protein-like protein [Thermodesulfatator indicus DSM 15286]|uniref:TVP38/TMEM64 family membrane protein n=1 Tax=Thermodesulfatator indicus (strain DSM 15286 / JCM 11887 / CIR29812) TaxID=667014 RepID=F8ABT8_THEID|nr:TVP38/TMEM64 family protein [Thermodesulfatator indicus]AEH44544.1 SNARE associated Golgi protein-like protein [Thermodesulfatator indicus DSM 15286]